MGHEPHDLFVDGTLQSSVQTGRVAGYIFSGGDVNRT